MEATVLDKVWIMSNGMPLQVHVYGVLDEASYMKTGVERSYWVCETFVGVGGLDKCIRKTADQIFATKADLLADFVKRASAA